MRPRTLLLALLGLSAVVGLAAAVYVGMDWMIPWMDRSLFPWLAALERRVGRWPGLTMVAAAVGVGLWLYVRVVRAYINALRRRLPPR
jgi:hypothetical protein